MRTLCDVNRGYLNTGFTLLEMMIVVLIIATMAAAISINITSGSTQKRIDDIGDKFYRQLLLAADTALLSGNTIGLQIEQKETENSAIYWQYAWYHHVKNRWQALSRPLTATQLPDDVILELLVEDELIEDFSEIPTTVNGVKSSTGTFQTSQATIKPEVVISSSGEITDFTLELIYRAGSDDTATYRIGVDETGKLTTSSHNEM